MIIKDLNRYIKNKENKYIPEKRRIEIETNEIIEQSMQEESENETPDNMTDRVNSLILTNRNSSKSTKLIVNYEIV